MGASYTPATWDAWTERMKAKHNNGNCHGRSLSVEAQRLLPTPTTAEATGPGHAAQGGINPRTAVSRPETWGRYATAIARAEQATGRPAPAPTEDSEKGPRLSPVFVEWLMMLPEGHVTQAGLSRNQMLKALGNGVVPAQAAAATQAFVDDVTYAARMYQPA